MAGTHQKLHSREVSTVGTFILAGPNELISQTCLESEIGIPFILHAFKKSSMRFSLTHTHAYKYTPHIRGGMFSKPHRHLSSCKPTFQEVLQQ